MIYWRIRQANKSWRNWSEGVSSDRDEAEVESTHSVLDENNELLPWAASGVTVEMWECVDVEDFNIDKTSVKNFRANYLGLPA